jgi:CRP-like cAMP-binding protein
MQPVWLEQGNFLFREQDKSECLFIVKTGTLEIYTTLENGLELAIDRLHRGSVLGLYTFLLEDDCAVGAKC